MKEGPDIALIGSLIGEPARANMLAALMSGKALTASELAGEAGVTLPTASAHLRKLEEGGLIGQRKQGRHRYFSLTGPEVGAVLEALMGLAAKRGHLRTRTGPGDPALREARVCYDHLAGELGVRLYDSLIARKHLEIGASGLTLTADGRAFAEDFGIDIGALTRARRPLCRTCLDWSARRSHLAGSLGAAFLTQVQARGWAARRNASRAVTFTRSGEAAFRDQFPA